MSIIPEQRFIETEEGLFWVTDELPVEGGFFVDLVNERYGIVESMGADRTTFIRDCDCNECTVSDRITYMKDCKKIIKTDPQLN